jgi:hypothetical protein
MNTGIHKHERRKPESTTMWRAQIITGQATVVWAGRPCEEDNPGLSP